MRGVVHCVICRVVTSDWTQVGRWRNGYLYACDDHVAEGKAHALSLVETDVAKRNARKKGKKR